MSDQPPRRTGPFRPHDGGPGETQPPDPTDRPATRLPTSRSAPDPSFAPDASSTPNRPSTGQFRPRPGLAPSNADASQRARRQATGEPAPAAAPPVAPPIVTADAAPTPAPVRVRVPPPRPIAPPTIPADIARWGNAPATTPPSSRRRRPTRLGRAVRALFLLALLATTVFAVSNQSLLVALSDTPRWQAVEREGRGLLHSAVSLVAEEPAFAAAAPLKAYPLCPGVAGDNSEAIEAALDLMRGTAEGQRLFDVVADNGVCITVEDLGYNSGYAFGRQSSGDGDWSDSYIAVSSDIVDSGERDVLAALLVHESTHIDRYIAGTACNYRDDCTELPNGVDLEEEVAAHGAEAEWWVDAYGTNGKRFATGYDYGVNRLARAWLEGPDVFREYVRSIRGDPREGSDLGAGDRPIAISVGVR